MAKQRRKSRFGSNVTKNVIKRENEGSAYGYLILQKGAGVFKDKDMLKGKGRARFDVIPYIVSSEHHMDADANEPDSALPGNPWYKKPFLLHRSIGAENASVVCPKTHKGKCPICEERARQIRDGMDYKDAIPNPQLRNLYVLMTIEVKDYEDGKFYIWDVSNGGERHPNFQYILDEEIMENPDYGRFPDPEEGMTLNVRFSKKSFAGNEYAAVSRIDFEERDEQYDESIMEEAPDLDKCLKILSYEEIERLFLGLDPEEEEKETEDDPPFEPDTVRSRKRKKVKKPELEEEEDEPEEEEEEELKPRKRGRTTERTRKKTREPEPEEEEEEEVDEPVKTAAKKKDKKKKKAEEEECSEGYEFGEDNDDYPECDDCPVFNACQLKAEEIGKYE